ncbi:hypothetical protein FIV31_02010 [Coxiella endosymbiont of Ornithodoros amblus]|nr:hypothetical protein [Coxiella endosymbiont of Ornithodoros amblus]
MPGASPPEVSTTSFFILLTLAPNCIDYLFSAFYYAFLNKNLIRYRRRRIDVNLRSEVKEGISSG